MHLIDKVKNLYFNCVGKYRVDSDGCIVSCFFNPTNSVYRLRAFHKFYESIKHLPHYIIELTIKDGKPQLPDHVVSHRMHSNSTFWHKESLLNIAINNLPEKYKYIFWVDADVIFSNKNWFVQACEQLRTNCTIVQPFQFCVHLEQDETPEQCIITDKMRMSTLEKDKDKRYTRLWRSFASRYNPNPDLDCSKDRNYDFHGHVGFAWGALRSVLKQCPLYDKCLVGGADHIIAHAAVGHFNHGCIQKAFQADIDSINEWSYSFFLATRGQLGYTPGDMFHIWHGDVSKRQYLKRIQDYSSINKDIKSKDGNGLYQALDNEDSYVEEYLDYRETIPYEDVDLRFLFDLSELGYNVTEAINVLYDRFEEKQSPEIEFSLTQEELEQINLQHCIDCPAEDENFS